VRAEHKNELTELINVNHLFGSAKRQGKDQAESLELMVIKHRRKNTEDEPRGVVFKHDLIGGNG
jgi:hypothetical protein